jgi:hypothetical protein
METLEDSIQKRETEFISTVGGILSQNCSSRIKMALINKHYIRCLVAIDDLVAEAKLTTPAPSAVSSN